MSDEEELKTAIEGLEALESALDDETEEQAVEVMEEALQVLRVTEGEEHGGLIADIADLHEEYDVGMAGVHDSPAAEQTRADRRERE